MKRDDNHPSSTPNPATSNRQGAPKTPERTQMPPRKAWLLFVIVLLTNYLVMKVFFPSADAPLTVPYTVFKQEVSKGNVKSIYSQGASIEGRFAAPVTWPPPTGKDTKQRL